MQFWSNVQKVLEEREMTARALAAKSGVTPGALSTYARGTMPSLDAAWRIAKALELSLDELISGPLHREPTCPAPDDHRILLTLLRDLDLGEVATISRLGGVSNVVAVAEEMARNFPRPMSLSHLMKALPELEKLDLEASLIGLRRRGLVLEEMVEGAPMFSLADPRVDLRAPDIGGPTQNALRAVRMILGHILPATERKDPTAHLITVSARIDREEAEAVSRELHSVVQGRARSCLGPGEGDTDLFFAFGIALDGPT